MVNYCSTTLAIWTFSIIPVHHQKGSIAIIQTLLRRKAAVFESGGTLIIARILASLRLARGQK
jgi:hypothetical protein